MAELYFFMGGWLDDFDKAKTWMNTRVFNSKVTMKDGTEVMVPIPANLQPIQLFKLVVPREAIPAVLNSIPFQKKVSLVDGKGTNILNLPMKAMRKAMHLKDFPDKPESGERVSFPHNLFDNLRIIGLGFKEDIDMDFPEGRHEAL